ncbi:MAG TPA: pirin family protein [Candidatus Aquilonibacter sp.]|nr:pirin family protein [Candidatus Aquilonibacter sp.]
MTSTASPVFAIQRSDQRAAYDHGWLKTAHSFSFADYFDPNNVQWGALRVFNDDVVAAKSGFPPHPHRDMEIITYVLSGQLAHEDSMGNRGVVPPGGVQYMSAGTGVRHSEFNASDDEAVHFLQMWVVPGRNGTPPTYGQMEFDAQARENAWLRIVSGAPSIDAPIRITQDATLSVAHAAGSLPAYTFAPKRFGFLFVATGEVEANGERLGAGDAVRMYDVPTLEIAGDGEIVLWDTAG